ncbi:MAG TPA: hypothetical protein VKA08_05650 [Balneolales bacterium]|nr:hypothetical protein [Balneolales bacterium]
MYHNNKQKEKALSHISIQTWISQARNTIHFNIKLALRFGYFMK